MTRRLRTMIAGTVLALASTAFATSPAAAAPADYHLTWFQAADGTDSLGNRGTYQRVIDLIRATEIDTDPVGEVTVPSQTLQSSCRGALPTSTATTLCWTSGDNSAEEWIPQGITTSNDGSGSSVSKIFVTWYDGCSSGTQGSDWGLPNQGCQDGPSTDEAADKGVRVSIYTPDVGYRSVLLVEPFYNSSHNPSFHAVHMHAGGVALYGNFLYVADTTQGMRVFDTRQIFDMSEGKSIPRPTDITDKTQVGRHDNVWYSHGYRWVWPAVGEWRVDGDADAKACTGPGTPLKFSYVSVDRAAGQLLAGEYCPEGSANDGRVARWRLGSQSTASSGIADGWAVDETFLPVDHVQGVVSQGGTFYVNASNGQSPGTLWRYQRSGTALTGGVSVPSAIGPEDLSYDTTTGNIYSLSEYYGRRAIYRIPASAF